MVFVRVDATNYQQSIEPNVWQFNNEQNVVTGFVLAGAQTAKRAEMVKLLQSAGV